MTTLDERHGEGPRDGDDPRGGPVLNAVAAPGRPTAGAHGREAVPLDQPDAAVPLLAGSKAANLARAVGAGLPVLPGFVITHPVTNPEAHAPAGDLSDIPAGSWPALRHAWDTLSDGGERPLVVRSSSPQEDTQESSLAGRFASVLDVRGWADFRTAVRTVLDSAHRPDQPPAPMAVLVQPMLTARVGGVVFGADPVEGRADRMLVSAVRGGPDSLVSGEQAGTNYWLSLRGRMLRTEPADAEPLLGAFELRRLARLARRAREVFDGPQDIEFGFDDHGQLWLFQSRPITAMAARPPHGARLLGPGPVAETLPDQLEPLEEDLWVAPMARGLAAALDIGGMAPRHRLRALPVVTAVGGRAAADLRLLGAAPPRHRWLALLNPAPGGRRLAAAWRTGRLASALPGLAVDLVADVDRRLAETPPPADIPSTGLASTLRWTRTTLVALHAQEALAGALLHESPANRAGSSRTAAGAALTALADARAQGLPDELAVTAEPVVLALTAPSLRGRIRLPVSAAQEGGPDSTGGSPRAGNRPAPNPDRRAATAVRPFRHPVGKSAATAPMLPPREALRLRVRWVQELQVRLVREGARRLVVRGGLDDGARVGLLRWPEFMTALEGGPLPLDVRERQPLPVSAPLPDAFRVAEDGTVVAERSADPTGGGGRGVSGGRAAGTVWDGTGTPPADAVLVVRTLDPALAPLLPGLTGLVAQTGSPLSHLAVLAREFGLPAVVGVTDAVSRFPPGTRLTVDGTTGDVRTGVETGAEAGR
ncbi:PEP/pyruvate-binding domain-containing protein [Streptomyces sp. NBC_00576]|uniref:PEP/pyruvate-binding domain-containing protein n=1 Tax=Streptomyces sp. NBC_00576 TaxID=2903665 RepID=UPI002E803C5D|nr:PEP/pyruvate-binding domain-containing protein [Streptomyces sp. NBC_00576]WUB75252.1 PEP-utilizing enzyme [Streptomyces sp. NBC_00576]